MKKKFCRRMLSLGYTIIFVTFCFSQSKPLKIGDTLPDEVWTTPLEVVNVPESTITLSDDKNKLILLDFWATWCSSCLKGFPKMEELKKEFGDRLRIIAVTDQNNAVLKKFFSSPNGKRYNQMMSVTGDQLLHRLFPHQMIPYIVWIKDGKVINTTDGEQVTLKTISEILDTKTSSLQTVIQIDRERPFMLSENFDLEKGSEIRSYSIVTKGRVRAAPSGTVLRTKGEDVTGRVFTNVVLMNIYRVIADELFSRKDETFSEKRIVNLLKNPNEILFTKDDENSNFDEKLYSFEYSFPNPSDMLYDDMLNVLNKSTPYMVTIEVQNSKCLILEKTSDKNKMKTKGGDTIDHFFKTPSIMKNISVEDLVSNLNANNRYTSLPVINKTGIIKNIDLELGVLSDLASLKKALSNYDISLREDYCNLPMLIIRDKNDINRKNSN